MQKRAIAARHLTSLGAHIEYTGGIDGGGIDFLAQLLMGPTAPYNVVSIRASGPDVNESAIAAISVFGELESLFLSNVRFDRASGSRISSLRQLDRVWITDSHISVELLEALRSSPRLQVVKLDGTQLEDEWLAILAASNTITDLSLSQTGIGDAGLKVVSSMKDLVVLNVNGNAITDSGVRYLQSLERLQRLDISRNSITDRSAKAFSGFTELRELNLSRTLIGDDALFEIGRCHCARKNSGGTHALVSKERGLCNLYNLNASHTRISDCGLMELRGLPRLISVSAEETQVSQAGAIEFRQYRRAIVTQ